MTPSFFIDQWQPLRQKPDEKQLTQLAEQVALHFLDLHFYNDRFEPEYVRLLCEMANAFDDDNLNRIGAKALFGIIVESLCDDFEELQTEAYNRLMSFVLSFCREMPEGKVLNARMNRFGMKTFEDLYLRAERLRKTSCNFRDLLEAPKRILVLSRVTLGADVAITSVLVQRLTRLYPDAELVLLGGSKLKTMFGGNPRLRVREINYVRRGGLMERLHSWFAVLEAIDAELKDLGEREALLVDPDSRLSQLGVLPLLDDRDYLFFNSRGSGALPQKMAAGELANYWFSQATGNHDFCYPSLWLPRATTQKAEAFTTQLRGAGCRKIATVNFGVGGNSRKRVGGSFEADVLLSILAEENDTVVLLDKGFGNEELARTNELTRLVHDKGYDVVQGTFDDLPPERIRHGVVGLEAGIGEAAALISCSDEFIGYDSACQHIAAALEVPAHTIFAGTNNTKFVRRWRAFGLGKSEIIHVDTLTHPPVFDIHALVRRLMFSRRKG